MNKDKFDYNYCAPNNEEKRWIESIRRQYLPEGDRDEKVAEMRSLHKKAKTLPTCISVSVGIIGTLIMGTGMAMSLEMNLLVGGIIVGIVGMAIMLVAYPVYQFLRERGKNKYGDRIVRLADELSVDEPNTKIINDVKLSQSEEKNSGEDLLKEE